LNLKHFCLDVDGVMTDGGFLYSEKGKVLKKFGAEDADALEIISRYLSVRFVSADRRGFEISRARVSKDLGFPLDLVPTAMRLDWLECLGPLDTVIYMGDSFRDWKILSSVGLSIAPANAHEWAKTVVDFVTPSPGGSGAVAEACMYLAGRLGLSPPEFQGPTG
jgi:3-deoxy-D-manno-octulosonate 8-phosphate phosphatase (KDO 8-P phosphatase)